MLDVGTETLACSSLCVCVREREIGLVYAAFRSVSRVFQVFPPSNFSR